MTAERPELPPELREVRPPGTPSLILTTSVKLLYPSLTVLGLYFLFAGHNLPGGGFVGGLLVAAAISLRYVAGGREAAVSSLPVPPHVLLGSGLLISAGTALTPVLLGGSVLEHGEIAFDWPFFGSFKVTSTVVFDIGVLFIVVGLILMAIQALGDSDPELFVGLDEHDDLVDGGEAS